MTKEHSQRADTITEGTADTEAPGLCKPEGSPALAAAPSYNSSSRSLTRWGLGWHADSDETFLVGERQTLVLEDGLGQRTLFLPKAMSATAPVAYTRPVGVFSDATATALDGQRPSVVTLREKDGTTREYRVFESTGVLRLSRLVDRSGNTVAYSRDAASGRLTRMEDVHGRFIDLAYSAAGLVERISDSGGRTTTYVYDAQKRRTGATGPDGTTSYAYDGGGRLARVTYPNGGVHNYTYDAQGRVASEDDGAGQHALSYVYESTRTFLTDALGRTTVYEYVERSGLKKITKVTEPGGKVTSFVYDALFNLTSVTDPMGRVTRFAYDASGNVTATEDPAGGRALASYEPAFNRPTSLTDPMNGTTSLTYDGQGNLTVVRDPLGQNTVRGYDGQGHITSEEDPLHQTALFSYEPTNGALKTATDPLNRTTALETEGNSLVTRNTDPSGKVTRYAYDGAGNLTEQTDALGGVTRFGYAPGRQGKQLETVTDALGHATSFGYDAQGRLTAVVNALSQAKGSAYDAKGNLAQTTNARGQALDYAYDSRDRVTRKSAPEGDTTYTYDDAGNLLSALAPNGSRVQNTYDALNRLTRAVQTFPGGYSAAIGYGYDAAGNRTSMTTPWGDFAYQYDALNRLTRITNPESRVFAFEYDAAGRRTKLSYPNGIEASYSYDAGGQVLGVEHTRAIDQAVVAKAQYAYDAAGNRTSMTDLAGTHTYAYDDLHRLTAAHHPAGSKLPVKDELFSYDAVGNRLADAAISGYTYDNANRVLANSSYTYTYDASGNRTGKTDRATSQAASYAYDSEDRMIEATVAGRSFAYAQDAQGRRIAKSSGTASSQALRYVYDGAEVLALVDGAGNAQWVVTHGPGLSAPLGLRRGDGEELYAHANALGSVTALSDLGGAVKERAEYAAYGKAVYEDPATPGVTTASSPLGNPFGFTGYVVDLETGLLKPPHRNFDPATGSFVQEDPIGFAGGDVNLFAYVQGNPGKYRDAAGLMRDVPWDLVEPSRPIFSEGKRIAKDALDAAATSRLPGDTDGPRDAYRHCIWTCQMTKELGPVSALLLSTGHELWDNRGGAADQRAMDLFNNRKGVSCAMSVSDPRGCHVTCKELAISGGLRTLTPPHSPYQ